MKKRIYYYDLLKIIASFMVLFYHFCRLDYGTINGNLYIPNLNRLVMNLCSMCVPLFFMVNGALLLRKQYTYKNIFYKICKIAFLIIFWKFTGFPSWFFFTLIILYCLCPILYYLYNNNTKYLKLIILFLFIFPFVYNYLILILSIFNVEFNFMGNLIRVTELQRTGFFTLYSIVYFVFGKYFSDNQYSLKFSITLGLFGFSCSIAESILGVVAYGYILEGVSGSLPTIGTLCMTIAFFNFCHGLEIPESLKKPIEFISPCILGIYIFHLAIIYFIYNYVDATTLSLIPSFLISIFIYIVCVLISRIFNALPILKELIKI